MGAPSQPLGGGGTRKRGRAPPRMPLSGLFLNNSFPVYFQKLKEVFATKSDFKVAISLQPDGVNL